MPAFKVDENLPEEIAGLLRVAGYDATTVVTERRSGCKDPDLIDVCRLEGRVLVTFDLDFADIRTYPPASHPGAIVLRLARQDKTHTIAVFNRVIRALEDDAVGNCLWTVDETAIRVHGKHE